jgi:hypothetical protein
LSGGWCFGGRRSGGTTLEGGRNSLHLGPLGVHAIGKLNRLVVVRQLALHPDSIAVRRVRNSAVNRALAPALEPVVPLPRPRRIPVEEDVEPGDLLGERSRLAVALALGLSEVLLREALLVAELAGVDGVDDDLVLRSALEIQSSSTAWSCSPVLPDSSAAIMTAARGWREALAVPLMNAWSRGSMLVEMRVAASASVRQTRTRSEPGLSG